MFWTGITIRSMVLLKPVMIPQPPPDIRKNKNWRNVHLHERRDSQREKWGFLLKRFLVAAAVQQEDKTKEKRIDSGANISFIWDHSAFL